LEVILMRSNRNHAGIEVRHARTCNSIEGGRCNCQPTYRAHVWSKRDGKRVRKTFSSLAEARSWRQDAQVALRQGRMRAPSSTTLREAAEAWLEGARQGSIRTRSGHRYKPSAVRSYEQNLRLRVLDDLGARRLSELGHSDLQAHVERLVGDGHAPSTIQGTIAALRTIFRREVVLGRLAVNPTAALQLPAVQNGRDRIVSPEEAAELLDALPTTDQALWATALYAGLRRGEMMALDWSRVDLASGVIRVERGWDDQEGFIEPKTKQGRRKVPIAAVLRDYLVEHRMREGRAEGLVFGRNASIPLRPQAVTERADKAWKKAKLGRITLHEARHTFASYMIAAGVNAKALSIYMGHSNISITLDRYGHLMPGNEDEAAGLLDAYIERANTAARTAQLA
jgi:integrase